MENRLVTMPIADPKNKPTGDEVAFSSDTSGEHQNHNPVDIFEAAFADSLDDCQTREGTSSGFDFVVLFNDTNAEANVGIQS